MNTYIPEIEEDISLPASAAEALPELTPNEELEMRVRTIKLIASLTGNSLEPTESHKVQAAIIAKEMTANPAVKPDFARYPNEVMAYLAEMIQQNNVNLVNELGDLKLYVVNKLVFEVEHAKDSKSRIAALSKLGEVDGVDAFKKRSEHTVKVLPIEEVEKELLQTLELIENVEYREISEGEPG
jgi:hypothetical protein